MMLSNPIHDFLKKAYPHARQCKIKELNYLEAELIMMEEEIMNLSAKGLLTGDTGVLIRKIEELKSVLRSKRSSFISQPAAVPTKMINMRQQRV